MSLRESRATNARRSRAQSVAIGRNGVRCHCEKANHNASNARGVTAGKMVCVSVKYRRPNRWTDQDKGGSKWEF